MARDQYPDASPFHVVLDPRDPSRSSYSRSGQFEEPTFCTGSTEDEINRAHEALKGPNPEKDPVFKWDPGRHKDAKNPTQCETSRLYDLATDRWYREDPGSLLKNIGAGIVNGLIPGSDLGDAGSSTQIIGQAIGGLAGSFVNPAGLLSSLATKAKDVSFLNSALNFATNVATGPFGAIATSAIGSLLSPTPTPMNVVQTPYQGTNKIQEYGTNYVWGNGSTPKPEPKPESSLPTWVKPLAWGVGALALLGILWKIFFTKKRK